MLQSANASTVFPYVRETASMAATTASFLQPLSEVSYHGFPLAINHIEDAR